MAYLGVGDWAMPPWQKNLFFTIGKNRIIWFGALCVSTSVTSETLPPLWNSEYATDVDWSVVTVTLAGS